MVVTVTSNEKIWTKSFISIFISNFFTFMVFYALLTSLPIYVTESLSKTKTEAGLVVTAFLLSAIIIRPFSGKLLDLFGKKNMLFISVVMYAVSSLLYIWVEGFHFMLALRALHGIWFSIATTATGAIAADVIPKSKRGEGLGYYGMSMNIAVVAGPFVALTLLQFMTFKNLFVVLTIISIAGVIFSSLVRVHEEQEDKVGVATNSKRLSLGDLFEKRALPIALVASLVAFSYSSVISFISIFAKEVGLLGAANFFFLVFALTMIIFRPLVGRLFDTKGPNIVIYPALLFFMGGLLLLSVTNSSTSLLIAGALIGLGYGSITPCFQTLAVQAADIKRSGHATATYFTFFDTGIALGSYVLGMVASYLGYSKLYLLSALLIIITLLLYYSVQSTQGRKSRLMVSE
jgi:predicted MFS family arabinose efflux permease